MSGSIHTTELPSLLEREEDAITEAIEGYQVTAGYYAVSLNGLDARTIGLDGLFDAVSGVIATRLAETLRDLASEWDVVWNRGHDNSVHPYSHLLREAAQRYTWDGE